MRSREWYGWHFPEMGKIVTDNLTYARTVKEIGEHETLPVYILQLTVCSCAGIRSSIESCDLFAHVGVQVSVAA